MLHSAVETMSRQRRRQSRWRFSANTAVSLEILDLRFGIDARRCKTARPASCCENRFAFVPSLSFVVAAVLSFALLPVYVLSIRLCHPRDRIRIVRLALLRIALLQSPSCSLPFFQSIPLLAEAVPSIPRSSPLLDSIPFNSTVLRLCTTSTCLAPAHLERA